MLSRTGKMLEKKKELIFVNEAAPNRSREHIDSI